MTTFSRRLVLASLPLPAAFAVATSGVAFAVPGVGTLVRETVELAVKKSGREVVERASREVAEQAIEKGVAKYGPRAAQAVVDGGMELVEASAKYGDDVMPVAVEATPAARRALALEPGRMLPLVRELGQEAVELEAKAPGLAQRVFTAFGDDGARQIARTVPAEDVPRLLAHAERAESPAVRRALLDAYKKEGPAMFAKITPKMVVAIGASGALVYGTHRMTSPFAALAHWMRTNPDAARDMLRGLLWIMGTVAVLTTVFVLGSFRLTPWHARRPADHWKATGSDPTGTAAGDRRTAIDGVPG